MCTCPCMQFVTLLMCIRYKAAVTVARGHDSGNLVVMVVVVMGRGGGGGQKGAKVYEGGSAAEERERVTRHTCETYTTSQPRPGWQPMCTAVPSSVAKAGGGSLGNTSCDTSSSQASRQAGSGACPSAAKSSPTATSSCAHTPPPALLASSSSRLRSQLRLGKASAAASAAATAGASPRGSSPKRRLRTDSQASHQARGGGQPSAVAATSARAVEPMGSACSWLCGSVRGVCVHVCVAGG